MIRNAFYAQSGGVTAVINASACGVLQTARQYPAQIGKVFAGKNGIIGALTEELIDTSLESDATIAALCHTPGGAFGSCRYKLKSLEQNRAEYERLIKVFQAHNIGYFFYNGGGDSADTCLKISHLANSMDYPIQAIHIPKTIDNDLPLTDCCPGFGSVAKYVATSIREAAYDVLSMARTSTQVFILEVMGRHAGWITAACGLAAESAAQGPHILLFPEIPFNEAAFFARVKQTVEQYDHCVIAVSEGIKTHTGQFLSETGLIDAFGHSQLGGVAPIVANLINQKLNYKCHWAVADYLQRSAAHLVSATDVKQAYAVGQAAVQMAIAGKNAVMPAIIRTENFPYQWHIEEADLKSVANQEKLMPHAFITDDGFHITEACRTYLSPLIQGEIFPPFKDGLPDYVKTNNILTPKKTGEFKL
jgi:6-phosphofructokinase 1